MIKRFIDISMETDLTSITDINRYGVYSTTKNSSRESPNFENT